jgi:hypothetical protein
LRIHRARLPLALAAAVSLTALAPLPARAHGEVAAGGLDMVVGWGQEPVYTGIANSVQVIVTDHRGAPVNDIADSLKAEVTFGSNEKIVQLEPFFVPGEFGEEGDYRGWLMPTEAGRYTFRIFGTYKGERINERIASGPQTFDSPIDASAIQFPTKLPSGAELVQRVERESARSRAAAERVAALEDDLDQARLVAIAAAALSLFAVAGLAVALLSRRRGSAALARPAAEGPR